MDSHDFIEVSDLARLLYSSYPGTAKKRDRERENIEFGRNWRDRSGYQYLEDEPRKAYTTWSKVCDEYAGMLWRLADLVAKRLPKVYEDLRLVAQCTKWHDEREFDWTAAEKELRRIEAAALLAAEQIDSTPETAASVEDQADEDQGKPEAAPVEYLMNWREILDELGLKNDEEKRDRIRRLNTMHGGPIIFQGRGAQPTVDKVKLVAWWNGLEDRLRELEQQQADRQATVADQVNYGKDGTVVPGIAGGVKKRRKDRKS